MKKILNLYFSPLETFKALNQKPDWLIPVIISIIVILAFTMVALPKVILPERGKKIMEMDKLTQEQKDRTLESLEGMRIYIITPVSIVIFSFLLIFVKSGIFYLVFSLFGSRTVFKKVLAVVSYSLLTSIPETILKTSLILIKGSTKVYTSLALFAPNLGLKSPVFKVLARIDIFTIWNLFLISLGLTVMYALGKKKTFSIVFGLWVIWLLIQLALGYMLPKHLFFG